MPARRAGGRRSPLPYCGLHYPMWSTGPIAGDIVGVAPGARRALELGRHIAPAPRRQPCSVRRVPSPLGARRVTVGTDG